jgi:hypothetical protein
MVSSERTLVTGACLIVGLTLLGAASPAPRQDSERELQARLQQETRPVKKAKYEIRLARLKLREVIEAFDRGDTEKGGENLNAYLTHIRASWQLLQSSGRNTVRSPEGFRDLDIALREDGRLLADLGRRLSFYQRGDVEKANKEIEQVRAEVIKALFPPDRRRGKASQGKQP